MTASSHPPLVPSPNADAPTGLEIDVLVEAPEWDGALGDDGADALVRGAAAAAIHGALDLAGVAFDPYRAEVAVVLADDEAVRRLNLAHRGRDRATNVLSFPLAEAPLRHPVQPSARLASAAPLLLGDVVLAFETVSAEAYASGIPFAHHVSHLVVHGVLHLLGHDHGTDAEAVRMEALEAAILARLGIPDPYQRDLQETHG